MTKNWLKYCFYSSSLCCNNIINGMNAKNRITNIDIEKFKNYNVNPEKICNERELKQDIYEKNMTNKEYYEKKKGQIENNYASFWKNNNLVSDEKFTNRKYNFRQDMVEMTDKIKEEEDKYNEEASEMKEEDEYNKKSSEVKEVIDKNSIKYIEENVLQIRNHITNNLFKEKLEIMKMKTYLEEQLNENSSSFLKYTSSSNIDVEYKDVLNYKEYKNYKEDIKFKESK